MDAVALQSDLRRYFATHGAGVVAAYLFGSMAWGTAHEGSDVDVGVLFTEPPDGVLDSSAAEVEDDLDRRLGRPVQVVALNTAPVDLAIRVLRAECLLYEGDASGRIRFEVRTRNEYFDLEPILRRYRRMESAR